MRILLTGGSGTVGRKVLEQLAANPSFDITAFDLKTRINDKIYKPYSDRIKLVSGDLSKKEEVEAVCKDIDFVIHLGAVIPPLADENPQLAYKVNVLGTQNLITSLERHSKHAFFLYASSVSVYGDRIANPFIRTGDPLTPSEGDEYAKTKIKAEELVKQSKLDWCIFRLSAIMGTGNHKMSGLMFHMPLATPMEITTPGDTARAFVNAVNRKELLSKRIFNLGGGEKCRISYNEFLSQSFLIFGLGPLDFPEYTFAEKNFHCGYYADGDELDGMCNFRNDTVESYFRELENSVSPVRKLVASMFKKKIKSRLLKQSEPYKAYHEQDIDLVKRFFN